MPNKRIGPPMDFTSVKSWVADPARWWVDPKIEVGPATISESAGTSECPDNYRFFRVLIGVIDSVFQVWT